jgi:photosystem II stability/assembly factor-like uncharacterized protein
MRRRAKLFGTLAVVVLTPLLGCPKKSRDETSHVAPDPVVASASASTSASPIQPAPNADPFPSSAEPVVFAHGDDVAWIFVDTDGRSGHTTDGGAHWTWLDPPKKLDSFTFTLARTDGSGWMTAYGETGTAIFRCDGAAWTNVTPTPAAKPPGAWYQTVAPFDRDVAYVVRTDEASPTKTAFFSTHDGGKTWSEDDVTTTVYVRDVRFFPLDRDRAWAMGEIDHGMSSMPGLLWLTDDGGIIGWKTFMPPPPNAGTLLFLDHTRGFLLASEGTTSPPNLWRTDDEGKSWKQIFDASQEIERLPEFHGDDAVLVAKQFEITRDGGRTWTKGSTRPEGAIGQFGRVLWRVDGGHFEDSGGSSWARRKDEEPLLAGEVTSIAMGSESTGWMVVQTKAGTWRVVGTRDGGKTFRAFAPPRGK